MLHQITTLTIENLFILNYEDKDDMEKNYNLLHDLSMDEQLKRELEFAGVSRLYEDNANFSQDIITNTQLDHDSTRMGFEQWSSCCWKRTNKCEVLFIRLSLNTKYAEKRNRVGGDEDTRTNAKKYSHPYYTAS